MFYSIKLMWFPRDDRRIKIYERNEIIFSLLPTLQSFAQQIDWAYKAIEWRRPTVQNENILEYLKLCSIFLFSYCHTGDQPADPLAYNHRFNSILHRGYTDPVQLEQINIEKLIIYSLNGSTDTWQSIVLTIKAQLPL